MATGWRPALAALMGLPRVLLVAASLGAAGHLRGAVTISSLERAIRRRRKKKHLTRVAWCWTLHNRWARLAEIHAQENIQTHTADMQLPLQTLWVVAAIAGRSPIAVRVRFPRTLCQMTTALAQTTIATKLSGSADLPAAQKQPL